MGSITNISSGNNRIVGKRFHPRDDELVGVYLRQKLLGCDSLSNIITLPEVNNLYEMEPWELPSLPCWPPEFDHDDQIWYFYHQQDPNKKQHKRVTKKGFWSVTGNPKKIKGRRSKKEIGFKRTMTFYYKDRGYARKKKENKTAWVMHENHLTANLPNQNTIVLYTLKYKEYEIADISSIDGQPALPCNLETCITEGGGVEDEIGVDDYEISLVDFDGNQQIMIAENGGPNFLISGMNSLDSAVSSRKRPRNEESGLNIYTENEGNLAQNAVVFCKSTNEECKTADISSNEDQQSLSVHLPCISEETTIESGIPGIQDWIETEELQKEPAAFNQVDDYFWNQLDFDDLTSISSHFTQSPTRKCCFDAETEGI